MKKLVYLFVLSLLVLGCEKEIPLEIPEDVKPKAVVNSLFCAGDTLKVELTNSVVIGSGMDIKPIKGAKVKLFNNEVFKEVLEESRNQPGVYLSTDVLQEGANYSLQVSTDYADVTSESETPVVVKVKTIDKIEKTKVRIDEYSAPEDALLIQFSFDDPEPRNYYLVKLVSSSDGGETFEPVYDLYYREYNYLSQNDVVDETLFTSFYDYLVFPDEKFNAKEKSYTFGVRYSYSIEEGYIWGREYYLAFYSLTGDYYTYLVSRNTYFEMEDSFFAEKSNLHTNVDGGLGIFAGSSVEYVPIDFRQWIND